MSKVQASLVVFNVRKKKIVCVNFFSHRNSQIFLFFNPISYAVVDNRQAWNHSPTDTKYLDSLLLQYCCIAFSIIQLELHKLGAAI